MIEYFIAFLGGLLIGYLFSNVIWFYRLQGIRKSLYNLQSVVEPAIHMIELMKAVNEENQARKN